MHASLRWRLGAIALVALALSGCKKRASQSQCDALLAHFAELVVHERFADAGPEVVAAEYARERVEAQGDDAFKNCETVVQLTEHECAMKATSSEALIKCLD